MKKTLYNFPNLQKIIDESEHITTKSDKYDGYETSVFYHEPTNTTFCHSDYPPGTHCCDDDPVIEIYGTKKTTRQLERLLIGEKTLIGRFLAFLPI